MITPIIANPHAGGGRCGRRIADAVARLEAAHTHVEVHRTQGPGHATALAASLWREGHRTLFVAGGDGTAFEVVDGLMAARADDDPPPRLGLLPLGTGNSFLRDVEIETADQAIAAVLAGQTRPVDVVRMTHDDGVLHYLNLFSIGFTSRVGALTNRWFKPLGAAGYAVATLIETARLAPEPFPHTVDDGLPDTRRYAFLSFSNSRCTGGAMQMAPDAVLDDGRLDVIRIGPLTPGALLRLFPRIYAGEHLDHPLNDAITAASVTLSLPAPVPCMIDGEVRVLRPTRLDVVPRAIEVLA